MRQHRARRANLCYWRNTGLAVTRNELRGYGGGVRRSEPDHPQWHGDEALLRTFGVDELNRILSPCELLERIPDVLACDRSMCDVKGRCILCGYVQ